jgi:hypothetical protein
MEKQHCFSRYRKICCLAHCRATSCYLSHLIWVDVRGVSVAGEEILRSIGEHIEQDVSMAMGRELYLHPGVDRARTQVSQLSVSTTKIHVSDFAH